MKDIVVVGGGTAGWMTAATMIKASPKAHITVYEDEQSPATGVGESTTQFFRKWLYYVGIEDEEWMKECDATYKISVQFHDSIRKGISHGNIHLDCLGLTHIPMICGFISNIRTNGPQMDWQEIIT